MSKMKEFYELNQACYEAVEAHYEAANKMQEILASSRDYNIKMHCHMLVLQSQSKMFAGKLKAYMKNYLGDSYEEVADV